MTTTLRRAIAALSLAASLVLLAPAAPAADTTKPISALADELLARMRDTSAYVRLQSNLPITELDPVTLERARQRAAFAGKMLARLDAIESDKLPHDQALLARMLRSTLRTDSYADQNYWFEFAVTPYSGVMSIFNGDHTILAAQPLKTAAERDNYLHLLDSYAAVIEQAAAKTRAQAGRGIRVPKPAIPGVVATFQGLSASVTNTLTPGAERLAGVPKAQAGAFQAAVKSRVAARIQPGLDAIARIFDDAYTRAAPDGVGISRYPGGKERYLRLITDHTGLKLTPQQIHAIGEQRIAELERRMQAIRDKVGFKGTREAFHESLRKDPRFLAKTPADVEKRYLGYVGRMAPFIPKYFSTLPKAPYGVRRLPLASEKGMTYGYYDGPSPAEPTGYYYYNGSDLDKRSLITAEHLIFHELIPGHHLHIALQFENTTAHPVRKFTDYTAFAEGWAEYAASLGEEMGLYSDPYDLYGHLLMQAFLTTRLVVDTGMNYLDMPLEDARAYMKAHTFESDVQIASESLRYSTDFHGQALAYRLGYEKIWELRHRAEKALGKRFDIRAFHAATVGEGAMPLDVLEWHIDWFIAQHQR